MDEMKLKLTSKLMKGIVGKMLSRLVYERLGYKANVGLNEIGVISSDGKIRLHLDVDADMDHAEFAKLVKSMDLD